MTIFRFSLFLARPVQHLNSTRHLASTGSKRYSSGNSIADSRPFAAGDSVILRRTNDRYAAPIFIPSLTPGSKKETHKGVILHDHIIGSRTRQLVQTLRGARSGREGESSLRDFRVAEVKLEEHVRLTRRLVTPLYPQDAALIVSLLDLHVDPPHPDSPPPAENERLEILEAGTGHGALTLHLSRAIHAANVPLPVSAKEDETALAAWKAARRAVIHTMDVQAKYSAHASKIVEGFRQGMYHRNIDFHVSSVGDWVTTALSERGGAPFLSHAFLDLPGTEDYLPAVAEAVRTDGTLVVFNPSISQIMDCLARVKAEKIPLELESVVELGVSGGSGGREWDVRAVKPRAAIKKDGESEAAESSDDDASAVTESRDAKDVKMVCRPKVGELVVGGGFVGVFRKLRYGPKQQDTSEGAM